MIRLRKEMEENGDSVVCVPGCIINDQLDTMSIKLIDIDVKSLVDKLIKASEEKSSYRTKPICGRVREGVLARSAFILPDVS